MDKEIIEILKTMQQDMKVMQQDMKSIKSVQEEHTQILRALEHRTEVISAEQENLKQEVAEVNGEVKGIRKDLKHSQTNNKCI